LRGIGDSYGGDDYIINLLGCALGNTVRGYVRILYGRLRNTFKPREKDGEGSRDYAERESGKIAAFRRATLALQPRSGTQVHSLRQRGNCCPSERRYFSALKNLW